jgi:ABC-2 type transport system permease protein
MMSLIKINLRALFSQLFPRSRKAKKRSPAVMVLIALLAVYVVGSLFMMFGTMFYQLSGPLFLTGFGWFYFALAGILVFAFCFVGSIFAVQAQIFSARDNDLLLSLPLRPSGILLSRIAALLILDYLFAAFIAVPVFVVWLVTQPVNAVGIVFYIIAMLVIPLASLAVASFFAWLVALITSRLRSKNIFTLILSLLFFAVYFWFFSNIQRNIQMLILNSTRIAEDLKNALFPVYHLGNAIDNGSVLSMLIFVICAVAPFVLAVMLLSSNFIKIATTNRGVAKIKYTRKALKVSGVRTAFVFKELRHFISSPMYILNTWLGSLFMVVGAVFLAVKSDMLLEITGQLAGLGVAVSPAAIIIAGLTAVGALNIVSAPSVSLEGKNLWIARSLPVRSFDVLLAKALMHILVCGVPTVLAALICAVFFRVTALQFILMLCLPLLFTVFTALLGVAINLLFPRLDWINEVQPIKQGLATILTMAGAAAVILPLGLLYIFLLSRFMDAETFLLLCAGLMILLSALLTTYLERGGSRRFEALGSD